MNRFSRLRSALAILFSAVLLSKSVAAQDAAPTPRPGTNASVTVEAESLRLNEVDRIAIFRGNVLATQGALTLRSAEMRVRYSDAAATGADGPEIERIDAVGGVVILLNGDEIRGEEATYDLVAQTFEAMGNVVLLREGNRVRGQRFFANLETGESEIVGRVTVEFSPGGNASDAEQ